MITNTPESAPLMQMYSATKGSVEDLKRKAKKYLEKGETPLRALALKSALTLNMRLDQDEVATQIPLAVQMLVNDNK